MKRREPDNNYAIPISFLRSFICCHSRPFFFFFFVARLFVHFSSSFSLFLSSFPSSLVSLSLLSSVSYREKSTAIPSLGRDREKRGEIMKQRREKLQKSRHRKRVTTDIVFEVSNPLLDSLPDSQSSEMKINFEQRANCPFVSLQKSEHGNM